MKAHEIPQCAAIIAVADTFDAITSKRVYREGYDLTYAINEISRNAGSQFDPDIANVFVDYLSSNADKEAYFKKFKGQYNRNCDSYPLLLK